MQRKTKSPEAKQDMPWSEEAALLQSRSDYNDCREELKISRHQLDQNWEQQPDLFAKVCDHWSEAVSMRDQAKTAVEEENAKIELDLRKRPIPEGEKITESQYKAMVLTDPRLKPYQTRYFAWKEITDRWSNLKSAFDQRKDALKGLSSLFVAGYFTATSYKTGTGELRDKRATDNRDAVSAKRRALASESD